MKKYSLFVFVMYMIIGCNNSNPKSKKHIILDSSESAISNNTLKDSMQSVKKKSSDYVTSIKKTIKEKNEAIQLEKESTINTIFISNNNDSNTNKFDSVFNIDSILSIDNVIEYSKIIRTVKGRLNSNNQNTNFIVVLKGDSIEINSNDSLKNEILYQVLTYIHSKYLPPSNLPVVFKLPHGPESIVETAFPKNGFVIYKTPNETNAKPYQEEFFKIWTFYLNEFNRFSGGDYDGPDVPVATKTNAITIKSSIISEPERWYFEDSIGGKGISNCEYQLQNFGKYKLYYILNSGGGSINNESSPFGNMYSSNLIGKEDKHYGLILFYDTTNHYAKVIKIFAFEKSKYNSNSLLFRFFYITKDKKILIYEGKSIRQKDVSTDEYLDEYKITLNKTHVISVDTNNEIVIENINNDEH